jgi:hypothetical protein
MTELDKKTSQQAHFLKNVLNHPKLAERDDLKVALAEYALILDPQSKQARQAFVTACKKVVSVSYSTRQFESFEKYLQKLKPFDPVHEQFFRLSSRQFLKADVTVQEWKLLLAMAHEAKSNLIKRIHSGLIVKLIHAENMAEAFSEFKKMLSFTRFARHDLRLTIALLRLALKKRKKQEILSIRKFAKKKNVDRDLRGFSKLKLFEVLSEIRFEKGGAPQGLWKLMMRLLKKTSTTRENKDYIIRLSRIFDLIEKNHPTYLDIRMAPADQAELQKVIERAIEFQKPFSLLRLGDADSYGLETVGFDRKIFEKDCEARERKWWGINLPDEIKGKTQMMFRQTLLDTDAIGIPSIFRFVSDLPDPWTSFLAERNQRGSVVVMDSIHDLILTGKIGKETIFTDNRCHYVLFDRNSTEKLMAKTGEAIIVSHYSKEQLQKVFKYPIQTVRIPGEGGGVVSLPYQMEKLIEELRSKVEPGSLVFVAAGFAGKYFLKVAKDQGAIALDVGAMADYWLGIKSRGLELV